MAHKTSLPPKPAFKSEIMTKMLPIQIDLKKKVQKSERQRQKSSQIKFTSHTKSSLATSHLGTSSIRYHFENLHIKSF